VKVQTQYLTGAALDWAAAICVGGDVRTEFGVFLNRGRGYEYFTPSTNPEQAKRIIKSKRIAIKLSDGYGGPAYKWAASVESGHMATGPTKSIAALRCLVASQLGDEVDMPEELVDTASLINEPEVQQVLEALAHEAHPRPRN
jgi:hypothetical protein